jgi:hypothetical protein
MPEACQHSSYVKISFSFNLQPKNPQNLLKHKKKSGNCVSWDFHQFKGSTNLSNFTCKWQNKPNSFFNNPCKMVAFEVIVPRWNHHQLVLLHSSHQWWGLGNEKNHI